MKRSSYERTKVSDYELNHDGRIFRVIETEEVVAGPEKIIDPTKQEEETYTSLWEYLMSRSYYHMGKFSMALSMLEKYEQLEPSETKTEESLLFLAATIDEHLRSWTIKNKRAYTLTSQ
ncbi:hypothetical protein Tco_0678164 [Tanacetum coccineum]|uniref:Uncharacterized protein n=1 Tax=Tanacetum coccineum TaxID=301880 RepID=A0ABQ4XE88_9ASTR